MKPADVKLITYIESSKENNEKDPKFEVGDHVRKSKYKNIFAKGYVPNSSVETFVITKVKNTVRGDMLLAILTLKKLLQRFMKKNCKKQIKKKLQ